MTGPPPQRLAPLEAQLAAISAAVRPDAWALSAYRLAIAVSEDAAGDRVAQQRALQLLQRAAALLDGDRAPLEHGRILNAVGAVHRVLGDQARSRDAFAQAIPLLTGRARPVELAAVQSNLGLALAESGHVHDAVATFDAALVALGRVHAEAPGPDVVVLDDEVARAYATLALNKAQALLTLGGILDADARSSALGSARIAIDDALARVPLGRAPLQVGMLRHTHGLVAMELDDPAAATEWFTSSIEAFSRASFPFQHAVARFNRGRAHDAAGMLQRALVDYEAAAQLFDPRLHREPWARAAQHLADLERRLERERPGMTRIDHVVQAIAEGDERSRAGQLRDRMLRLVPLPEALQRGELRSLIAASLRVGPEDHDRILRALIETLMELPEDLTRSALAAELDAHGDLTGEERVAADRRLDLAIQAIMLGPQRVRIRDILYAAGWERP